MAEENLISKLGLDISNIPRQVQALGQQLDQATSIIKKFNGNANDATSATIKGIDELGRAFTKTVTTLKDGSQHINLSMREVAKQTQVVTAEMKKMARFQELEKVAAQIEKIRVKMASLDAQGKNKNYYDALNESLAKLVRQQATLTSAIKRNSSYTAEDAKRLESVKETARAEEKITIEKAKQLDKKNAEEERKAAQAAKERAQEEKEIARQQEQQKQLVDQIFKRLVQMVALRALRTMWREATQYATEYYDKLNEIRLVTGKTQEEANALGQQYRDMADELKVTSASLVSSVASLYRQGLGDEEVAGRLEQITKFATVAGVEIEEATRLMTSSINNFTEAGETGGQAAQRIADTYANYGDRVATTAENIATAMTKTAASASNVGVTLERTAAYASTILAVTQDEAESVGNALNTIISRYSRITKVGFGRSFEFDGETVNVNDVAQALSQAAGINIFNYDTGEFRDFGSVLDELAAKWDTLEQRERNYIATQLAGTRQYNRVLTLMQNYDMAMGLLESSYTDTGTVAQKYAIWTESVAAAQNNLKNSLEDLYSVLSGETLKTAYNFLAGLVDMIAAGIKLTDGLPIKITAGAAALGALALALGKVWQGVVALVSAVQTLGTLKAFGALTGGNIIKTLTSNLGMMATGIAGSALILTTVIGGIARAVSNYRQQQEENFRSSLDTRADAVSTLGGLGAQQAALEEVGWKSSYTASEMEKLNDIRLAILRTSPEIAKAYGLETESVLEQANAYTILSNAIKSAQREKMYEAYSSAYANRGAAYTSLTDAGTKQYEYAQTMAGIAQLEEEYYQAQLSGNTQRVIDAYDSLSLFRANADKLAQEFNEAYSAGISNTITTALGYDPDIDPGAYAAMSSFLDRAFATTVDGAQVDARETKKRIYEYAKILVSNAGLFEEANDLIAEYSADMSEDALAAWNEKADEIEDKFLSLSNGDLGLFGMLYDENPIAVFLRGIGESVSSASKELAEDFGDVEDEIVEINDSLLKTVQKIIDKRNAAAAAENNYRDQWSNLLGSALGISGMNVGFHQENGTFTDFVQAALVPVANNTHGVVDDLFEQMGNVYLWQRKIIDANKLIEAGWEDVGQGIATLFSNTYTAGTTDEYDFKYRKDVVIDLTPITPSGKVLTQEELESYIQSLIGPYGTGDILENDKVSRGGLGLVLQVTDVNGRPLDAVIAESTDAMIALHEKQQEFYQGEEETQERINETAQQLVAAIQSMDEATAGAMLEEYSSLADIYYAVSNGQNVTAEMLQAVVDDYVAAVNKVDDTTQDLIDSYKQSQLEEKGGYKTLFDFGMDWDVFGLKQAWNYLDDAEKKIVADFSPAVAKALAKDAEGVEDLTEEFKDFNDALTVLRFKNLEDAGKIISGTSDAIKNAADGGIEWNKSYASMTKQARDLYAAQRALAMIQGDLGATAEELSAAYNTLASYAGMSAEDLQNNLAPAEAYVTSQSDALAATIDYLNQYLYSMVGVRLDPNNLSSGMAAIGASANDAAKEVAALIVALNGLDNVNTIGGYNAGIAGKGTGRSGATKKASGGGGGGGGTKKTAADKMIEKMKTGLELSDHARELAQQAQAYYEVRRELQGVIRYQEVERRLVEEENVTLQGYLDSLEKQMQKTAQGSEEYQKLAAQHQEYSLRLLKNKTDVENLTKAIKEQYDAIRNMEIELRNTILQAIEDREAREERMLDGRIKMENEMLALLKKRYEKERDEILETADIRKKALEDEKDAVDELLAARKKQEESDERLKEIAELEAKISRISADPTRQKEASSLREQLAKLRNDLAWEEAENEAEAQKKSLDDQIQNIEDYKQYVEDYYEELLNNPRKMIEEVSGLLEDTDAAILEWLKANSEEYAKATDATQQSMVEGWQSTLLDMRGAVEVYWEEVENIIAQGDDYIIQFLKEHSAAYAEAGKLQAQAYVDEWMDQLEALHLAYKVIEGDIAPYSYSEGGTVKATVTKSSGGSGGTTVKKTSSSKAASSKDKAGSTYSVINSLNSRNGGSRSITGPVQGMYANGGLNTFTGLALLHGTPAEPEAVLNPGQTKLFQQLVAALETIPRVNIPGFGGVDVGGFGGGASFGDVSVTVNVNSLDSDTDIEDAAGKLGTAFLKEIQKGVSVSGVRF